MLHQHILDCVLVFVLVLGHLLVGTVHSQTHTNASSSPSAQVNSSPTLPPHHQFIPAPSVQSIPRTTTVLNPYALSFHHTRIYGGCVNPLTRNYSFSGLQPWLFNFDYRVSGCGLNWRFEGKLYSGSMYETCVWSWQQAGMVDPRPFAARLNRSENVVRVSVHPDYRHVRHFLDNVLPGLASRAVKTSVILHTGGTDNWPGMENAKKILASDTIKRWVVEQTPFFGESIINSSKVLLLPTGLCQKQFENNRGEELLNLTSNVDNNNWQQRKSRVLFCFSPHGGHLTRAEWIAYASSNASCDMCDVCNGTQSNAELWQLYKEYKFIASPLGNGPDCGRTWEILLLGAVPIIASFPGALAYQRYPFSTSNAILINNVTEVNAHNTSHWESYASPINSSSSKIILSHEFWSTYAFFSNL